jgi:hypothetical protein
MKENSSSGKIRTVIAGAVPWVIAIPWAVQEPSTFSGQPLTEWDAARVAGYVFRLVFGLVVGHSISSLFLRRWCWWSKKFLNPWKTRSTLD